MPEPLIKELQALLGADRVLTDAETLAARTLDTWPLRLVQRVVGAAHPQPLCVVRPQSTEEISRTLGLLYRQGVPFIPYGGGSGVTGGAEAVAGAVAIDLSAMNRILALHEQDLLVTAEAGVLLGKLEAYLNEHGYISGHYPQSIEVAQLGGLVATRSAGQFSTHYGNQEDLLVGLEAVLPDGRVVRIGNTPRRSVGPDLRHLWLGSEGALGVITEVTLKIFPQPAERWLQAYAVPSMRQGLEIIRQFMREGWRPPVVRLHDAVDAARMFPGVTQGDEAILMLLAEGPAGYAQTEGAALERICRAGGSRELGTGPVEHWLAVRNDVHEFDQYINMGIIVDTIEVAAGWSAIADIYDEVTRRLRGEVPEVVFLTGHSSHSYPQGTNLYFIIGAVPPRDPAKVEQVYWSIWERVMASTLKLGGTISHHHGVGRLRTPWVEAELGTAYPLLAMLKQAVDPKGLANPGALIPKGGERPR
ncbi:MAG: FAD-binding oxidoreductase [Mycobacterium leprae]